MGGPIGEFKAGSAGAQQLQAHLPDAQVVRTAGLMRVPIDPAGALTPAWRPGGTHVDLAEEFHRDYSDDLDTAWKVVVFGSFMGGGTTVVEALRSGLSVNFTLAHVSSSFDDGESMFSSASSLTGDANKAGALSLTGRLGMANVRTAAGERPGSMRFAAQSDAGRPRPARLCLPTVGCGARLSKARLSRT